MASKIKVDQIQTINGSGTIALQNQLSGMTNLSMPSGTVLQQVRTQNTSIVSTTTVIPEDSTIPQNNEGVELWSLAITPTSSSSILVFHINLMYSHAVNNAYPFCAALFQDSTANALACRANRTQNARYPNQVSFTYHMTAGTTSSTTFKVRAAMTGGTTHFNKDGEGHTWGGLISGMTITEYKG